MAGLLRSGKPLSGTEGVLTELTKHVVAKSMDAELGEHLRTELMAFLRFGLELRRLIYSKGSWATTKALMIQVYLGVAGHRERLGHDGAQLAGRAT